MYHKITQRNNIVPNFINHSIWKLYTHSFQAGEELWQKWPPSPQMHTPFLARNCLLEAAAQPGSKFPSGPSRQHSWSHQRNTERSGANLPHSLSLIPLFSLDWCHPNWFTRPGLWWLPAALCEGVTSALGWRLWTERLPWIPEAVPDLQDSQCGPTLPLEVLKQR